MSNSKPWDSYGTTKNRRIGFVIDHTNYIEYEMKKVLVRYLGAPDERTDFIKNILLHSSVLNLSAKFKLLHYIVTKEGWPTLKINHFHRLLAIRNAFAHSDTVGGPTVEIGITDAGIAGVKNIVPHQYTVESISSSGKHETMDHDEILEEFIRHYEIVLEYLHNLLINHVNNEQDAF